jgi:hypothetical protein
MTRTRVKGTAIKAASSPETEPDFYQMEYCPEPNGSISSGPSDSSFVITPAPRENSNSESSLGDDASVQNEGQCVVSLESPVATAKRSKRVPASQSNRRRSKRRIKGLEADHCVSWTVRSSVSPVFDIPAFVEVISNNSFKTDDSSIHSHCSSTLNWLDEYFSTTPPEQGGQSCSAGSTLNTEQDNVSVDPIASPMSEPEIMIDPLELATEPTPSLDEPCNGDLEFFEGHAFCYLEHIDSLDTSADNPLYAHGSLTMEECTPSPSTSVSETCYINESTPPLETPS